MPSTNRDARAAYLRVLHGKRWSLSIALALLAFGCGGSGLRRRVASEFSCDESQVHLESLGAGGVRATGCGRSAVYTCTGFRGGGICVHDDGAGSGGTAGGSRASVGPAPTTRLPPRSDESIRQVLGLASDALQACLTDEIPRINVRLTVNELGRVTYSAPTGAGATREMSRCVALAFRGVAVDERAPAPRTVTVNVSRGASDEGITDAEEPSEDATDVPEATPPADAAAIATTLRVSIATHRSAILACVGGVAIALTVEYTPAGAVTVALRGALAASAEAECVSAVLADVRVTPAPGVSGSLIHAVAPE